MVTVSQGQRQRWRVSISYNQGLNAWAGFRELGRSGEGVPAKMWGLDLGAKLGSVVASSPAVMADSFTLPSIQLTFSQHPPRA